VQQQIEAIQAVFRGELLQQESLALHSALKVGGPADLFAIPRDVSDLQNLVKTVDDQRIPRLVIGGGYNLLVRDGGFRGVAISLEKMHALSFQNDGKIHAEAGVRSIDLARLAEVHGLSGLEFLVGIPGTVGGALRMNAGAHGGEIFDDLVSLEVLGHDGFQVYEKKTLNVSYRSLQLDPNKIIIAANFQLVSARHEIISAAMDASLQKRKDAQKVRFPNVGSFFKNPPGQAAWRLIDEAGLRGMAVGGAQVSEVHTNFLVNRGGATAADFVQLAAMVKEKVFSTSGIRLEEEVRITGED
jgi:UDP-N-acetylmuramate dehydrogenase